MRRSPSPRAVATLLTILPLGLALPAATCHQDQAAEDTAHVRAVVDTLLPRLQVLAGLPAVRPIRIGYRTRPEVRAYIVRELDRDLPPAELTGLQGTYVALGLIPDTLQLRRLLVDLYSEQVGGYYDPETKTFYTVEGTPPGMLRTVLAHELVHALQDQHVNVDSLVSRKRGNDPQAAAQAAIEGQATAVMFVVLSEQSSRTPIDPIQLPDLGAQLRPALEAQNSQFPVFRRAPLIIREGLIFPYLQGASFVQALWRTHARNGGPPPSGWPAPLDSLLPQSTEQVMHPERCLRVRDQPTRVVLGGTPDPRWRTLYENGLGELETTIFLRQHLGSAANARGWDGDRFRLLEAPGGGPALVWYSVWDDPAAADAFAAAYQQTLARRPQRHASVERLSERERPVVRVIDAPVAVPLASVPVPPLQALEGGVP